MTGAQRWGVVVMILAVVIGYCAGWLAGNLADALVVVPEYQHSNSPYPWFWIAEAGCAVLFAGGAVSASRGRKR